MSLPISLGLFVLAGLCLIDRKPTGLAAMRKALADLVQQCDRKQPAKGCPIIQVLEQD